jgi:hypothetical protein
MEVREMDESFETDPFASDDVEMGVMPAKPGAVNWLIASGCTLACAVLGAALIAATG